MTPVFRNGHLQGSVCSFIDISDRKRAEVERELMLRELDHRIKNLFAIASGMVSMTARTASTPTEMAHTLKGRLDALARAHDLVRAPGSMAGAAPASTTLRNLVETVTAPHGSPTGSQVNFEGPEVRIGATSATSFSLVLHELATNATKYGALSVPGGEVNVQWQHRDETIELIWCERKGPPIAGPPDRSGFGTRLATMSAAGQLGGDIAFEWQEEGVRIVLTAAQERLLH